MDRDPFVYMLASRFRGTIYTGVTSDLMRRIWEHCNGIRSHFPGRYGVFRLVHVEAFGDIALAIGREKQLKNWHRPWKVNLIEANNPHWLDLAVDLGFDPVQERPKRPAGAPDKPNPPLPHTRHAGLGSASSPPPARPVNQLDPEPSSG